MRRILRTVTSQPWFATLTILILAVGIGATTAIFSVVHAVVLRSLPYEQPDRIVRIWADNESEGDNQASLRVVEVRGLEREAGSLEKVGAFFATDATYLDGNGEALRLPAGRINAAYFDVFGVQPAMGRFFTEQEIASGADLVAVVSHAFWTRFMGSDAGAVGRTIAFDGTSLTVVGILPATFDPPSAMAEVYIPYSIGTSGWIGRWLDTYGLLAPNTSISLAGVETNGIVRRLWESEARTDGWTLSMIPLRDDLLGNVRTTMVLLLASVGVVLLIACANVASLLLARASVRQREIAVRLALGGTRQRVMQLVLQESLSFSLAGGALGVALAFLGVRVLTAFAPADIPRIDEVGVNVTVLTVAAGAAILAGLLAGVLPAWLASREYPGTALSAQTRGSSHGKRVQRFLGALIVAEIAMTVTLLTTAGLVMRSFVAVRDLDTGFNRGTIVAMELLPPSSRYGTADQVFTYYSDVVSRVEALPEVEVAGVGSHVPLTGRGSWMAVNSERRWAAGEVERVPALQRVAFPSFFATLDVPLIDGRLFNSSDDADAPERVLINETLAQRLWPSETAVGKRLTTSRTPDADSWMEVIGVVGDLKYQTLEAEPEPQVYQPHPQQSWRALYLFARGSVSVERLLASVRQAVRQADPSVRVAGETSLMGVTDAALAGRRFSVLLFGLFAGIAMTLAVAGVYGTLTFVVSQRVREMGIRVALGARGSNIARLVLSRVGVLLVLGGVSGVALAGVVGGSVRSLLFGIQPMDPLTIGTVILALTATMLLASAAPARRASRTDPAVILREE